MAVPLVDLAAAVFVYNVLQLDGTLCAPVFCLLLGRFQEEPVICHFLIFLHLNAEIARACKVLGGGELEEIEVESDLLGECLPDSVEFLIAEDQIQELFDDEGAVLDDLLPVLGCLDNADVFGDHAQFGVLELLVLTPELLVEGDDVVEGEQDCLRHAEGLDDLELDWVERALSLRLQGRLHLDLQLGLVDDLALHLLQPLGHSELR
jgi:hypothetical protein